MRIELRDKPEEKKEPVAKVWLERESSGCVALWYQTEDGSTNSLAYFNEEEKRFHVFGHDARNLGYRVTTTGVNTQES